MNLDIYCFQELDETDYNEMFEPLMKKWGYNSFYQPRLGEKTDGCALFYKRSKVNSLEIKGVEFAKNEFIKRENVGIVAILEISQGLSKMKVCVATTHILFNMRRVLCGDMNAEPGSTVLNYLTSSSVNVSVIPETVMSQRIGAFKHPSGTFSNSINEFHASFRDYVQNEQQQQQQHDGQSDHKDEHDNQVQLQLQLQLQAQCMIQQTQQTQQNQEQIKCDVQVHAEQGNVNIPDTPAYIISQPFNLKSTYTDSRRTWTTFHAMAKKTCDFILYGHLRSSRYSTTTSRRLRPVASLELPCSALDKCGSLPTRYFGSDHLSLATKFQFVSHNNKNM
ncbi:Protein angel 2 [Podila epigama]|nr:Protein angel 2 [Podila epigama]